MSHVLSALHPWMIWNEEEAVLRKALGKVELASSPALGGWIAARIGLTDPAPQWPPGVAFPLSPVDGGREGAIGFVAFGEPDAPDSGGLVSPEMRQTVEVASRWWQRFGFDGLGKGTVWVPHETDGRSLGLAALLAGLLRLLHRPLPLGVIARCPFAATGVLDDEGKLQAVASQSLAHKLRSARRVGFESVLMPDPCEPVSAGQDAAQPVVVPSEAGAAVVAGLFRLLPANLATRGFVVGFARVVNALKGRVGDQVGPFLECLLVELRRLPDAALQVRELAAELDVDTRGYPWKGSPEVLWKRLLDDYLPVPSPQNSVGTPSRAGAEGDTPHRRLARFALLATERNPNSESARGLIELSAIFARAWHCGSNKTLSPFDAFDMIKSGQKDGNSKMEESNWAYTVLASVGFAERPNLIRQLVAVRDHRILNYAITAAVRLGAVPDEELRDAISRAWRSDREKLKTIKKQQYVVCRPDAVNFLDEGLRHQVRTVPRYPAVELCRYPVTNADFECLDPSRRERRPSSSPRDDSPVVGVTWFEAANFAYWAGLHLPTALEWLSAAAPQGWEFPFPLHPDGRLTPDRATFARSAGGTTPVDMRDGEAASFSGCREMCGNVWEWLADWFPGALARRPGRPHGGPVEAKLALGGGWKSEASALAIGRYAVLPVDYALDDLGFRCVRRPARKPRATEQTRENHHVRAGG